MRVCVCLLSVCVCVCNCIASCLTPTRHNVSLTSPSLPISQFAPLYTSPTLPPPKYKHKVQTMQSEKNNFRCLFRLSHPLCVSRSSSFIFFLSNCGKRAPSRILFCSLPVVVAALKQINLANIICCCCGSNDVSLSAMQSFNCIQGVSLLFLLSQRCQLHVRVSAGDKHNEERDKSEKQKENLEIRYSLSSHCIYSYCI